MPSWSSISCFLTFSHDSILNQQPSSMPNPLLCYHDVIIFLSGLISMQQCIKGRQSFFSPFLHRHFVICFLSVYSHSNARPFSSKLWYAIYFLVFIEINWIPNLLAHVSGSTQPKQLKTAAPPLTDVDSNSPATMLATSHQTYGCSYFIVFI